MKNYRKSGKIHSCKIKKDALLKLVEIIKRTFPDLNRKEDFEVSTNLPNISIHSNSIENFLEHEELPDKLNTLSIRITETNQYDNLIDLNIDKSVRLDFYDKSINLNIHGEENAWVIGKYTEITDFLKEKRPWFWFIHTNIFCGIEAWTSMLLLIVFVSLIFHFIDINEIIYAIITAITLFIFAYIYHLKKTIFPYTQIIIKHEKSFLTREDVKLIILLLSLFVMILGIIIQFLNE